MTTYAEVNSKRILVVHDDALIRCVLSGLLEAEGYELVTASSGLEGLRILRESFFPFDLLVTDFRIPQMSSAELAWECARLGLNLRVLYVSDSCECEQRGDVELTTSQADELLLKVKELLFTDPYYFSRKVSEAGGI
jgi:CheY-like chemotaxis protein